MTNPGDPVTSLRGALEAFVSAQEIIIAEGRKLTKGTEVQHTPPETVTTKGAPSGLPPQH